jgi:hypothetical protein
MLALNRVNTARSTSIHVSWYCWVVQVQQLIVAVEAVKEEVAKLLAKAKAKAKEEERVEREAGSSSPSSSPPTSTFSTAQEGPSPVTPVTPPVSSLFSPAVSPPQVHSRLPLAAWPHAASYPTLANVPTSCTRQAGSLA